MVQENQIIEFVRSRDYKFERFLDKGKGATGETALMRDEQLNMLFVCKKYSVDDPLRQRAYYDRFVEEVRLLFKVLHPNIVRVFSCYLYPSALKGFIIMEYVDGSDLRTYLEGNPGKIDLLFRQTIQAFQHLEDRKILHRDIRASNIMVTNQGQVKVIDFGFGKTIESSDGFGKSISLNWPASEPKEFQESRYDFSTECYFLGKLYQTLIDELAIEKFSYREVVRKMCEFDPSARYKSFREVNSALRTNASSRLRFTETDRKAYLKVADFLSAAIVELYSPTSYEADSEVVLQSLKTLLDSSELETYLQDVKALVSIFITSGLKIRTPSIGLRVDDLIAFFEFYERQSEEKRRTVLANFWSRFADKPILNEDDIPF